MSHFPCLVNGSLVIVIRGEVRGEGRGEVGRRLGGGGGRGRVEGIEVPPPLA